MAIFRRKSLPKNGRLFRSKFTLRIQGKKEYPLKRGFLIYAPNVLHSLRNGPTKRVVVDIFSPPRQVYQTPGEGYGTKVI
jgi:hypothetical protein